MKTCNRCKTEKDTSEFYPDCRSRDGIGGRCKPCMKAYHQERAVRLAERGYDAVTHKTCSRCDTERPAAEFTRAANSKDGLRHCCKSCAKAYKQANKDRTNELQRKRNEANKAKRNEAQRNRLKTDPAYALTKRAACQAYKAFRGAHNAPGFFRHMPYTKDEFSAHLLSTLPEGYVEADACDGSKLHIDHIRPVSSFNLTGEVDEEFLKCWALDNLQLLPAAENIAKGDSLDWGKR